MKKLLLIFILIYQTSCSALRDQSNETAIIDCPRVFFSSENKVYADGLEKNIDLKKMKKLILKN